MLPVLFVLFIAIPIAELYVIVQVGQAIGILPTLAILIVDSLVGAALARSQGRAAWTRFQAALGEGRIPGREVFDGAMVILGGALLLTPGFITDIVGLLLLFPPTRALLREALGRSVKRHPAASAGWRVAGMRTRPPRRPGDGAAGSPMGARPRSGRSYDVEGSAHEVAEPTGELPPGEERG